ncbi:hypothetical protein GTH52_08450 [Clostridium tyrobutyricum]|uniref:Uncharacterized protein n=1 Tax=Clostridium tyrobutyricum DIVETGP TaxID=1408889 RepID=W6NEP6_CLOTY|nr:hypothetical protein [Clostridium tyrobutyricum]AND83989.1 hypothetical protein CTK_C07280 [Clostridium tyrobutyricum]ANP68727.1 hypothetical protein BA182_03280 [Clostridium tyrobutyricum]MBV4415646.1 hypothetical protein [Clostridium tyrobutyricum]MBV4434536.1 hypothetical protein [Clostridium tyrobutyricum]MBV4439064.1 hypothetical protein [Clostridium tyrobutyricum]
MIFFLYTSGIFAILVGIILFHRQNKKIKNKDYNEMVIVKYWTRRMVFNIIVMFFTVILVLFIIPFFIWHIGPKEFAISEKIIETKELSPISTNGKNNYVREVNADNSKNYQINTGTTQNPYYESYNYKSVELIKQDTDDAQYEKIYKYRMKILKGKSLIIKSVNDIYSNVYIQYDDGKYVGSKIKIIIPNS